MKRDAKTLFVMIWILVAGLTYPATGQQGGPTVRLKAPVGALGTVSFRMKTDREYHTGPGAEAIGVDVLEINGIAKVGFAQSSTVCELQWIWARGVKAENLMVEIPELPGQEEFFIQYTWDAAAGRFTGYVNGTALRLPETQVQPWSVSESAEIHLATGPFKTELVSAEARYLDETQARAEVPKAMLGRLAELFGVFENEPQPMDVASRLGQLLYGSEMDAKSSVDGWVMEGPGSVTFEDGWMTMASDDADSMLKGGHIVYWCPRDFPESFVAEWEMRIRSTYGLCIVFFAARGLKGEDLFDPSLPERTGVFRQYTDGPMGCYHISYHANTPSSPGRITSNMRKNSGFYLVSNGPPGIDPGSDAVHAVRLIKDGARIQLQVDGKVIIDWTDDGQRYGPKLMGGKIGFRQMQWTTAQYRDLRIHELRTDLGVVGAKDR